MNATITSTEINRSSSRAKLPKLLLVTDTLPPKNTLEEIFLSKLLNWLGSENYSVLEISEHFKNCPAEKYAKHSPLSLRALHSYAAETFSGPAFARDASSKIQDYAGKVDAQKIWFLIRGQTSAHCAAAMTSSKLPVLTQIVEQPNKWMGRNNIRGFAAIAIRKEIEKAIQNASSWSTTSTRTEHDFSKTIPVPTGNRFVVQESVAESLVVKPATRLNDDETFTIGMFGYGSQNLEMLSLVKTLNAVDWRIRNRDVLLRILGNDAFAETTRPTNIEYLGLRSEAQMIRELSACDVLFCANNLSKAGMKDRTHTTGLAYLLASGRPIVYLGPDDAPTRELLEAHSAAVVCDSDEEVNISLFNCFDRLIFDPELYRNTASNTAQAFTERCSQTVMFENFARFIREKS